MAPTVHGARGVGADVDSTSTRGSAGSGSVEGKTRAESGAANVRAANATQTSSDATPTTPPHTPTSSVGEERAARTPSPKAENPPAAVVPPSTSTTGPELRRKVPDPLPPPPSPPRQPVRMDSSESVLSATSVGGGMADRVLELTARAAAAEARAVAEMEKAREAERKVSDLQHTLTALQSLHTTLTHETTSLRSRTSQLDQDISTLRQDNTNLRSDMTAARAELASLRSDMATLRGENTSLRNHNAQLLGEINSLRSAAPGSPTGTGGAAQQPPQPRPPTSVRRMMFAIGDYEPREEDEIAFGRGDEIFVNLAFADGWGSGFHTTTQASGHFPLSHVSPDPPTAVFALDRTAPNTTSRMDSLPQFSNIARAKGQAAPPQDVVGPPGRTAVAGVAAPGGVQGQHQMVQQQQQQPLVAQAVDQWRPQPHPLQIGAGVVPGLGGAGGQGMNPTPVNNGVAGGDHRWRTAAQAAGQGQQAMGRRDDEAITARVGDMGGGRV